MAGTTPMAGAQNQTAAAGPSATTGTGLAGSQTPLNLGQSNLGYINPGQYAGWQGNLGNFLNMFNIPQTGQAPGMQALGVNNNTGINVSQPNAGNTFAGFGQYLYPLLGFLSNFLGPTPNTNVNVAGAPNVTPQSGSFANFATPAPVNPNSTSGFAQRLDNGVGGTGAGATTGTRVGGGSGGGTGTGTGTGGGGGGGGGTGGSGTVSINTTSGYDPTTGLPTRLEGPVAAATAPTSGGGTRTVASIMQSLGLL